MIMNNGQEVEYANSMGVSAIVESLQNWSLSRSAPTWDTTIVNVLTLIRNNFTKEESVSSIAQKVIKDMDALTISICAYNQRYGKNLFIPYILYYLPYYNAIPLAHRRNDTETRIRYNLIVDYIRKELPNTKDILTLTTVPVKSYFIVAGNNYVYPHFHVVDKIRYLNNEVDKDRVSSMQRKYVLLSHCPLDFHMWSKIPFRLFETYTGNLKEYKELGQKVFKFPYIPFNRYTHILFGDSIHIKPMVVRNTKKAFTDLAYRDKWIALGDEGVKASIIKFDNTARLFLNNLVV